MLAGPRLLGWVELVPYRLERPEGLDDIALLERGVLSCAVLPAHRGDRPCAQLGRREQPTHLGATFAAFGIDATYTPAGGGPVSVRVIARRLDTIVGFGATRIHAETATFEVRAREVTSPRPSDQLTVGGETFIVQGDPERRGPERLQGNRIRNL